MARDPFLESNPMVGALEAHRARIEQIRENSARHAQAFQEYKTDGVGEFVVQDPQMFGLTFTEEPMVAYSWKADAGQLVDTFLPRCNGGVIQWVQDARGFYIGANVMLSVDVRAGEDSPTDYKVSHNFTFSGIAFKDLPAWLLDFGGGSAIST